ncbi:MAG: 2TM domain-containing protein [Candidatus Dojkabacteria bacterium]
MNSDDEIIKQARQRVGEKIGFLYHLIVYVTVNTLLLIVNLVTSPHSLWFYWVSLFWGIGLLIQGLNIFAFGNLLKGLENKMLENEIESIKKNK